MRRFVTRVLSKTSELIGEFRAFVLRGNVVDLAVGVVIGAAFQTVVTGFVQDLLTPLISIPARTDFQKFYIKINGSTFQTGDFVNKLISFLLIAGVVFFLVVRPINSLISFSRRLRPVMADQRECPFCTSQISVRATRCPFCTAEVEVVTPTAPPPLRLPFSREEPHEGQHHAEPREQ